MRLNTSRQRYTRVHRCKPHRDKQTDARWKERVRLDAWDPSERGYTFDVHASVRSCG